MRVLLVNSLYAPYAHGGAERSVQLLAESLAAMGHEAHVATLAEPHLVGEERLGGVTVHRLPLRNLYWPWSGGANPRIGRLIWNAADLRNPLMERRLADVIRRVSPDVAHTNNLKGFSPGVWRALQQHGVPVVHTLRDYYLCCLRGTMFRDGANCVRRCAGCSVGTAWSRHVSSAVHTVVGISRHILEVHLEAGYFRNGEHTVIRNSVAPVVAPRLELAPSPRLRLGFMGRLQPSKGLETLLAALTRLPEDRWTLKVAGTGDDAYVEELRRLHPLANIEFLGHVPPTRVFDDLDLMVVPSVWNEPLSRVVLESYAHATPVLGARRGGIPEIIDEGATGFTYDADSVEELAARLSTLAAAPAVLRPMRARCAARAADFSAERIATEYVSAFTRAAASPSPRAR